MKPVNLAVKLAAAETELARVKMMVLAHVKLDRGELRQEQDDWRREAEMLCAEKLIAAKLKEADAPRSAAHSGVASLEARSERLALCA